MKTKGILLTLLSLAFFGCNKPGDYLYVHPDDVSVVKTQKIKEVSGNNKIDLFWVIGGMTEQADNFRVGVTSFMNIFLQKNYSWRMQISSSNVTEPPYLGMPTIFDNNSPNPGPTFVTAVMAALNGLDDEQVFDPIQHYLGSTPAFFRNDSTLAIVITNDNYDESTNMRTAAQMLQFLQGIKGDLSKVIVYGVFGATDLGCQLNQIDLDWNYHGSAFEQVINATHGQTYSLCSATFGDSLGKIGDDLYQRLDHPRIYLKSRPRRDTIKVWFHGKSLPSGDQAAGGVWYYSYTDNSIVFYSLDFAPDDTESVTVTYNKDTGRI